MLKADGVWELLLQMVGGQGPRLVTSLDISSESGRLLQAVSSWSSGCAALRRGEAAAALGSFEKGCKSCASRKDLRPQCCAVSRRHWAGGRMWMYVEAQSPLSGRMICAFRLRWQ